MWRACIRSLGFVSIAVLLAVAGFLAPIWNQAAHASAKSVPGAVINYPWHTSRAELLRMIDQAAVLDDNFYAPLEHLSDPRAASDAIAAHARISQILNRDRAEAARLPDGPTTRYVPLRTVISESLQQRTVTSISASANVVDGFGVYTYYDTSGSTQAKAGFVDTYFSSAPGSPYSYGLAAAVRTDLEASTSRAVPHWLDGGGTPLYVLICVNSVCVWKTQLADLQILDEDVTICYSSGVCVLAPPCAPSTNCPRKHISLWDSGGPDSVGNGFTVGDAHHDITGHACPDDWDQTRDYAGNSPPLIDVYATSYTDAGNAGTVPCPPGYTPAYHNGLEYNVWLQGVG